MKRTILISIYAILLSFFSNGQENRFSINAGYPINKTKHWLIDKWENPINFGLNYKQVHNLWIYGAGIDFSKYNISWNQNYYSGKNNISSLNPYVELGFNINNGLLYTIPHLDLGYSFIIENIEIWNGNKSGIYSGIGLDFYVNLTKEFMIGLGTNYNLIFNNLHFEEITYPQNVLPIEDKFMKSWSIGIIAVFTIFDSKVIKSNKNNSSFKLLESI